MLLASDWLLLNQWSVWSCWCRLSTSIIITITKLNGVNMIIASKIVQYARSKFKARMTSALCRSIKERNDYGYQKYVKAENTYKTIHTIRRWTQVRWPWSDVACTKLYGKVTNGACDAEWCTGDIHWSRPYAVKVKRHNVCKRHGFLDKQIDRTIFLCDISMRKI